MPLFLNSQDFLFTCLHSFLYTTTYYICGMGQAPIKIKILHLLSSWKWCAYQVSSPCVVASLRSEEEILKKSAWGYLLSYIIPLGVNNYAASQVKLSLTGLVSGSLLQFFRCLLSPVVYHVKWWPSIVINWWLEEGVQWHIFYRRHTDFNFWIRECMLLYTPVSIGHGINCRGRQCVSPTICLYQANSSSSASSSLAKL